LAFDMHDIEYTGGVKMDILTVKILDKIKDCQTMIQNQFLLEE
jgi:DNA polymerase III alpha subunit